MAGQGLAALGSSISESFFGGLAQQRQEEQAKKDKELAYQLAAFHALMDHSDTPEHSIPDILDMQAKALKAPKEFYQVTQQMRQAIQQHGEVPSGPEQSREIPTPQIHYQLPTADTAPMQSPARVPTGAQVDPGYFVRANQPEARGPLPGSAEPSISRSGVADETPAPTRFTTESVVPMAPPAPTTVTYQPTKAYGDMTQGEAADYRKNQSVIQQQKAILERQQELADAAGDRATAKQKQDQINQLERIETRAAETRDTQDRLFESRTKLLEPTLQSHAKLRMAQIEAELTARNQNPNVTQEELHRQAGEIAFGEVQANVAAKQAVAARNNAEVAHWRNTDAARLVGKGGAATQGMSPEQARTFRANIVEVLPELNAVRGQLEHLKTLQAQGGGTPDPAMQARITELEKRHTELLLRVKEERDKVAPAGGSRGAPRQASPAGAPPSTGTFDMAGWVSAHPNATEAEKNSIRSKAKARNLAVVE